MYWFTLCICLLLIGLHAETEHPASSASETQKTLTRMSRASDTWMTSNGVFRFRRDMMDGEEIWGMAKKVAITVFVVVSLCIVCCIVSTIFICVKCCCRDGNNNRRKRNQVPTTIQIPQPIFIQSGPVSYPQQAASPPSWMVDNHPMLPQPSAPPPPMDNSYAMDRPPAYEKVCMNY